MSWKKFYHIFYFIYDIFLMFICFFDIFHLERSFFRIILGISALNLALIKIGDIFENE